jgi:hypothetical protein
MIRHLTPEEVTSAVDGVLSGAPLAHAQTCVRCGEQVQSLRATLALLQRADDGAEPSPLFWDHFSVRVRAATAEIPVARPGRWKAWWYPALAVGVLAVVLVGITRQVDSPGAPAGDPATEQSWEQVVALAGELSGDEIEQVAATQATVLFDDLTADEQAAFARLLERELGADQ